jgi:hypothetical protein
VRRAFGYFCVFAFGLSSFASAADSRSVASASDAYDQRLLGVVDRAASAATDRSPAYIGASIHFSFRIDPAGHVSRVRVFAERASDRRAAQIVARAIQTAHFPPPPAKAMVEQGRRWYDLREYVFLVGAD